MLRLDLPLKRVQTSHLTQWEFNKRLRLTKIDDMEWRVIMQMDPILHRAEKHPKNQWLLLFHCIIRVFLNKGREAPDSESVTKATHMFDFGHSGFWQREVGFYSSLMESLEERKGLLSNSLLCKAFRRDWKCNNEWPLVWLGVLKFGFYFHSA